MIVNCGIEVYGSFEVIQSSHDESEAPVAKVSAKATEKKTNNANSGQKKKKNSNSVTHGHCGYSENEFDFESINNFMVLSRERTTALLISGRLILTDKKPNQLNNASTADFPVGYQKPTVVTVIIGKAATDMIVVRQIVQQNQYYKDVTAVVFMCSMFDERKGIYLYCKQSSLYLGTLNSGNLKDWKYIGSS